MGERIGSVNEPGMGRTTMGIPIPRSSNDFQINHHLLLAVKDIAFSGLPDEKALDHLDAFHRLCSVYQTNNAPIETVKSIIFPFSLVGEAEQWVKTTPSEFLTTWNDVEKEFLNAFFPQHLTRKIRTSIANFRQGESETFDEAWKRFSGYLRDCPHHGLKRSSTFAIFYRGCNSHHRELLDSSSRGSFTDLNTEEGELLIRKAVKNSHDNREQHDLEQREVFFCGSGNPNDDGSSQMLRDMNREDAKREAYKLRGNPFHFDKYGSHPGLGQGFRETIHNPVNLPSYREEFDDIKGMLKSIMRNLESDAIRLDDEMDRMAYRIGSKIDNLEAGQRKLLIHVGVLDERLDKESAFLEKEEAKARSLEYCQFLEINGINPTNGNFGPLSNRCSTGMDLDTLRKNTILREEPIIRETSAGFRVMMKPNSVIAAPPTKSKPTLKEAEVASICQNNSRRCVPIQVSPNEKKNRIMKDARAKILDAISIMENSEESKLLLESDDEFKAQYDTLMGLKANAEEKRLMTGTVKEKNSTDSFRVIPISEPEDPGCFSIPCTINGMPVSRCIIDSGASKSMMPLRMAKLAGLTSIKHSRNKLVLADGTSRKLEGIAENVTVDFKGTRFLIDFMILDTTDNASSGIILGRPFIVAAHAHISEEKGAVAMSIFGYKQQGDKTAEKTKKKNHGARKADTSREYAFYLGTVRDETHASKGKSSSFKKSAIEKKWRLKEKGDPGGQFFNALNSLRVSPAH